MSPMTAANPGTVWILGAGFSRSLGAPLFRDLFRSDLQILASIGYLPVEMKAALDTYRSYAPSDMGGHAELGTLWNDPEDFLYKLESATAGSPYHRSLFPRLAVPDIKIMAHMTTAALAIECSHFLVGDDLKAERWMPYRRWASQLNENDTVLTFNYDRVPELLSGNSASPEGPPMLEVAVPPVRRASNDRLGAEVRARGAAPVFKMHGSVDWWKRNGLISSDPLRTFHDQPDSPVLGIPGPGKLDLRSNAFSEVWSAAKSAIREAGRVVFVGYRFPQTDAQARFELLQSIRDGSGELVVEVVLGPDVNHPDVARMRALLGLIRPSERIKILPLYAEDYIGHF